MPVTALNLAGSNCAFRGEPGTSRSRFLHFTIEPRRTLAERGRFLLSFVFFSYTIDLFYRIVTTWDGFVNCFCLVTHHMCPQHIMLINQAVGYHPLSLYRPLQTSQKCPRYCIRLFNSHVLMLHYMVCGLTEIYDKNYMVCI